MKSLVVEDSRIAREGLLKMLLQHPEIDIVGDAESVQSALALIKETQPELIFLDIHMPEQSGFELLELLDYEPKVIFTTAYSDHAIRSFDYNTVDYLLKPIRKERLREAILKLGAWETSTQGRLRENEEKLDTDSRIFIRDNGNCYLVDITDIDYIESCKNYVRLFFNGTNAFVKKSLNQTEARLPEKTFFRANRRYIVNLKSIKDISLSPSDTYELTMRDKHMIEVSRRNSTTLKELLSL